MNEFEKDRYTRQENYDINTKNLIDFNFEGKIERFIVMLFYLFL